MEYEKDNISPTTIYKILAQPLVGESVIIYDQKGNELAKGMVITETKNMITIESKGNKKNKGLKKFLKSNVWIKLEAKNITFKGSVIHARLHDKIKKLAKYLKIK